MARRLTGAASDALLDLVRGTPRPATVVGAGQYATYVQLDAGADTNGAGLLALVSREAVRVPCAIVLADTGSPGALPPTELSPGARATVGANQVSWDGGSLTVVRWWSAARVTSAQAAPTDPRELPRRLSTLRLALGEHRLPAAVPLALAVAADAIGRCDPVAVADAVRPVLGLGTGLTPSADDAVAGLLLAARSWGGADGASTVSAVGALLAGDLLSRTTAVSAGLLRHAAEGRGAPEVVAAVEHLTGSRVARDEQQALARLLALGHSSGRDTALGVLAFLQHQTTATAHRPTVRESA